SWYKQTLGQKPFWVARSFRATTSWNPSFSGDSQNGRINIQKSEGTFNLTIANLTSSDEATYYCAGTLHKQVIFGNGTFLALKGNTRVFQQNTPTIQELLDISPTFKFTIFFKM